MAINDIRINELQVSTVGADFEFVELFGPAGQSLTGLSLLEIEGDATSSRGRINSIIGFTGAIPADQHYAVLNAQGAATYAISGDQANHTSDFQNGTGTYLLVSGFTGTLAADLEPNDDGALDLTPWSLLIDSVAITDGGAGDTAYSTVVIGPDGTFLPSGGFREPSGGPFSSTFLDFNTPDGTPGTANPGTVTPPAAFVINEVRISAPNDATSNFVELFAGAGMTATNLTLLAISGEFAPGTVDVAINLSDGVADADGFLLIANTATTAITGPGDVLVNNLNFAGAPTTFLLVEGYTRAQGVDLDTNDDGVLDATPWTRIVDSLLLIDGDAVPIAAIRPT